MNVIELPLTSASEKTQDEFVEVLRILAHKLSQPLTCLRGSAEVALMGKIRESECREVLELSLEETHRMTQTLELLRDVLEMEGAEEGVQPVNWKRSIEKSLQEAMSVDGHCGLQFVCDIMGDVWVKASPQHLDTATRRLISRAIKERGGETAARIVLSVDGDAACLSICGEGLSPNAGHTAKVNSTQTSQEALGSEDPEWWLIRRAVECQGGWLKISRLPDAGHCYQLCLQLAFSEVPQNA